MVTSRRHGGLALSESKGKRAGEEERTEALCTWQFCMHCRPAVHNFGSVSFGDCLKHGFYYFHYLIVFAS